MSHIWREANRAADYLAGLDSNADLSECNLLYSAEFELPTPLLSIVLDDRWKIVLSFMLIFK